MYCTNVLMYRTMVLWRVRPRSDARRVTGQRFTDSPSDPADLQIHHRIHQEEIKSEKISPDKNQYNDTSSHRQELKILLIQRQSCTQKSSTRYGFFLALGIVPTPTFWHCWHCDTHDSLHADLQITIKQNPKLIIFILVQLQHLLLPSLIVTSSQVRVDTPLPLQSCCISDLGPKSSLHNRTVPANLPVSSYLG